MLSPGVAFSLKHFKHGAWVTEALSLSDLEFVEGGGATGAGGGPWVTAVLR